MVHFVRKSLIIVGLLLILDAIIVAMHINFNMGLLGTLLLGMIFTIWGVFIEAIHKKCDTGWKSVLYKVYLAFVALFIASCLSVGLYGQFDNVSYKEDAVIVLGAGIHGEKVTTTLKQRLDTAAAYHLKNPDAIIVVSGGQGKEELISEALAMERYLVLRGIPSASILREEASTSTYENFLFSKRLLDKKLKQPYRVSFISNGFHILRAQIISAQVGLQSSHLHAPIALHMLPMAYVREFMAFIKYIVLRY